MTARPLVLRCADALPLLHANADGELHAADARDLDRHVAGCLGCRAARDQIGTMKQRLAAVPEPELPAGLLERIAADVAAVAAAEPPLQAPRSRALATALSAAAVAALGLGVVALAHRLPLSELGEPALAGIFARHARDLPADVVSSRPAEIERFLKSRLHPQVRVPVLARAGFVPLGARLIDIGDRAAAQVNYGAQAAPARRVTLVVVPDGSGALAHRLDVTASPTRDVGAVHGALWAADNAVYALLNDDNPATVRELAALAALPAAGR